MLRFYHFVCFFPRPFRVVRNGNIINRLFTFFFCSKRFASQSSGNDGLRTSRAVRHRVQDETSISWIGGSCTEVGRRTCSGRSAHGFLGPGQTRYILNVSRPIVISPTEFRGERFSRVSRSFLLLRDKSTAVRVTASISG